MERIHATVLKVSMREATLLLSFRGLMLSYLTSTQFSFEVYFYLVNS